jgi:hypothetical protein
MTGDVTLTRVDATSARGLRVAVSSALAKESSMRWMAGSMLAAVAVTACAGNKHTSPDAGADGITPQMFITELVTDTCQHAFSCMSQYPTTTGTTFVADWGTSQDDCVSSDDDYVARDQIAAAITAGKITWDPASAVSCLGELGFPATCAAFFTSYDYPDICYQALSGNVADGGACTTGWECSGDNSDCTSGKCAPSTAVLARHRR